VLCRHAGVNLGRQYFVYLSLFSISLSCSGLQITDVFKHATTDLGIYLSFPQFHSRLSCPRNPQSPSACRFTTRMMLCQPVPPSHRAHHYLVDFSLFSRSFVFCPSQTHQRDTQPLYTQVSPKMTLEHRSNNGHPNLHTYPSMTKPDKKKIS
jgi:hypothetical protein